jgi:hypothetical protein
MKSNTDILKELRERITRLESRLVQLMIFLGANPNGRYEEDEEEHVRDSKY